LAAQSEKIQAESPAKGSILSIETKPLPAALLRIAPIVEPEASSPMRWAWIVAGVVVIFGLVIEGNYWLSRREQAPVSAKLAPSTNAPAKPTPAVAEPLPTANPTPQPSVDLRSLNSQSAPDQKAPAPAAEQLPVLSPGQPLQPLSTQPVPVQDTTALAGVQSPVPAPSQPPDAVVEQEPRYITIGEGQSLIRIAHANHVPAAAIAAANHLQPPYALKAGSRLLIPQPDPPADQDAQASGSKAHP